MRQALGPGALGRPRGIGWRGRWEGGSGIHVNPWLIHVNVWQKPLQYCKVISLQLIKKKWKKKILKPFKSQCLIVTTRHLAQRQCMCKSKATEETSEFHLQNKIETLKCSAWGLLYILLELSSEGTWMNGLLLTLDWRLLGSKNPISFVGYCMLRT